MAESDHCMDVFFEHWSGNGAPLRNFFFLLFQRDDVPSSQLVIDILARAATTSGNGSSESERFTRERLINLVVPPIKCEQSAATYVAWFNRLCNGGDRHSTRLGVGQLRKAGVPYYIDLLMG